MNIEMVTGVVAIVLVPCSAMAAAGRVTRRAPSISRSRGAGRVRRTLDTCYVELGTALSVLVFVLACLAATIGTMWVLGKGAHAIQGDVDWPVWRWFAAHQNQGWTNAWWHITNMGSPDITQKLAIVGSAVMVVVWRKRLWWLPPLTLCAGYLSEKYIQIILKFVVDRGHPPHAAEKFGLIAGTHGTWPSGGCARVLVIYGLITYFAVRAYRNGRSREAWVVAAGFVSLALTVQAYARLNNMEHWITDVLGGTIFGVLLLAVMVSGAEIIQRGVTRHRTVRTSITVPLARSPEPVQE